jgi:BirA family biotin operon repressor/biotin-[acetyl-CoA-carboxylase] ligase
MMDGERLQSMLPVRGLGQVFHFFESIGSTNDFAKELAQGDAPHGTLVVADEQTAGKGRGEKRWLTRKGCGLALSVILRPEPSMRDKIGIAGCMAALAVLEGMAKEGLAPEIKWPNDVLIGGSKAAGVLVEAAWSGANLASLVVGIGVNVTAEAVLPADQLDYPATCMETWLDRDVDRMVVLLGILESLARWWPRLGTEEMLQNINQKLAYRDQEVRLVGEREVVRGIVQYVREDGRLRITTESGEISVGSGGMHLIPLDLWDENK